MSVLSKLIVTEKQEAVKFPKLYEKTSGSGLVVLFTDYTTGMVINPSASSDPLGDYSKDWLDCTDTKEWKEYDGVVELKNE